MHNHHLDGRFSSIINYSDVPSNWFTIFAAQSADIGNRTKKMRLLSTVVKFIGLSPALLSSQGFIGVDAVVSVF